MVCLVTSTVLRWVIDKDEIRRSRLPGNGPGCFGRCAFMPGAGAVPARMDASTNRRGFRVMADVPPVLQWLGT